MSTRIVITGAPGSGKSSFLDRLKEEPVVSGYQFFGELARRILTDRPELRSDWPTLHQEIYRRQVAREDAAGARSFVTDRGTVDAFAFHPETLTAVGTSLGAEYLRYTAVIQLGSAAGLGQAYYTQDAVRQETGDKAMQIERALRAAWEHHPNYFFVAATEDIQRKYDDFLKVIVHITIMGPVI